MPKKPAPTPPAWWRDAVIYQIYVRSMADANGDGRGDLAGITSRLPFLARLGVDAVWLNPCYPSPQRDHGYDIADYFSIEPDYGTLADFDELVAAAGSHGIKVLMDVVPNHCSNAHPWFTAAVAAGPNSPERERFWFRDGRGKGGKQPPNNWRAIFGGSAWTRITEPDGTPGQWYLHVFTPWQPDLNWYHPDVIAHFDEMLRFWFDRGVEGFRVDAASVLGKHPDLPDTPAPPPGLTDAQAFGYNEFSQFYPTGHEVWKHWRKVVDQYAADHPGRSLMTVSEIYGPLAEIRKYMGGDEFHQSFAFDMMLATWRADTLRAAIADSLAVLEGLPTTPAWTLNNHDTQRIVTRLGRADAHDPDAHSGNNLVYTTASVDLAVGTRRARAAIALAAALPGAIYLYYGEELGLEEFLELPDDRREDPLFIRTNGAELGRDGCRIPMPWTIDAAGAHGFSSPTPSGHPGEPWLPQPQGWGRLSVEAQEGDPDSMLEFYRTLFAARRAVSGDFEWVEVAGAVAFRRGDTLVVLNPSRKAINVPARVVGAARPVLCSKAADVEHARRVSADACVWYR